MSTKAQDFRLQQSRTARPPKTKRPAPPRRDERVDTSERGVSATQRKAGGDSTAARNRKKLDANKGGAKLEDSQNGRPSRKSTRKSAGHDKRTSNLELRQKARIRHV